MSAFNFCACVGPEGKCPCITGIWPVTEVKISPEVFASMDPSEQELINNLKTKAAFRYAFPASQDEKTKD